MVRCIAQHRQSTCISHKKDSKQTYVSLYTGLSDGRTCYDARSDDGF